MRLFCRTLGRLLLAGMILALPRVALGAPDGQSPISLGNLSEETVENLFFAVMSFGGCAQ